MTRYRQAILALAAALVAASCAPLLVTAIREQTVELSRYRTYGWAAADGAVPGDPRLDNNPFFHQRVRAAIDRELQARGFVPALSVPDLRVQYHASATQRIDIRGNDTATTVCHGCAAQVYDEGTLVINLTDPDSGAIVWRGSGQTDIAAAVNDQARMERIVDRLVRRILDQLPRQEHDSVD
jgi:hypothetical protein